MEERKFVCKYCNKRYPCGKSLGGHIRTHMNENSTKENADRKSNAAVIKFDAGKKRKRDLDSEAASAAAAGNSIYGLRENPKKSMRFVHSGNNTSNAERFCKECGKGFSSLKALCGHMACHSEKEKGMSTRFESNSGFSENKQKLEMDSQSDTETSAPNQYPRRSKRTRFKNVNNQNSSANLANGSSSVSEVEQEQEEVARCLMLLSKDFSHKGHFSLVTESSDTNSVVLEAKSPSVDMKFAVNNGKKSVSDGYEILGKKVSTDMKLKSAEIDTGDSDNSDSGYFRYGPKKADSDFSVDGVLKSDNFTGPKVEDKSGFAHYDAKLKKNLLKDCRFRNNAVDFDNTGRTSRKYESLRYNSIGVPRKKTANNFPNEEIYENGDKEWKYECVSSEKANGSYDSAYESEEDSTDTESYPAPKNHSCKALNQKKNCSKGAKKNLKAKKSKWHECPICYKIFKSGQALGGHKRSHFVGSFEENTTLVIRQSSPPPHPPPAAAAVVPNCLIDLNLPAPMDE